MTITASLETARARLEAKRAELENLSEISKEAREHEKLPISACTFLIYS